MKSLEIPVPEDLDLVVGVSEDELKLMAQTALAIRLFSIGRITSGQAANVIGISRREFLFETSRHGLPSVSWDDEELAAEKDIVSASYENADRL